VAIVRVERDRARLVGQGRRRLRASPRSSPILFSDEVARCTVAPMWTFTSIVGGRAGVAIVSVATFAGCQVLFGVDLPEPVGSGRGGAAGTMTVGAAGTVPPFPGWPGISGTSGSGGAGAGGCADCTACGACVDKGETPACASGKDACLAAPGCAALDACARTQRCLDKPNFLESNTCISRCTVSTAAPDADVDRWFDYVRCATCVLGCLDACPSTGPLCSLAGAGGAGGAGDASGQSGSGGAGGVVTVSFAVAVQPVLEQHCVSCHETATAAGLFLRVGQAAENHLALTTKQTACDKFKTYVVAGKPDESYLYLKVLGTIDPGAICDTRMPPPSDAPLPAEEVEIIRQWILTGANP
jgi:hypothetical protein